VVEDNVANQRVAVWMIDGLGYRADVAANGREALEMLAKMPYAAVLMDCQMPQMDGFEATAILRRREAGGAGRVPIIAMTANAMRGDRERCLASGMDDYIAKPVRSEDLAAVLERWARRDRQERVTPLRAASARVSRRSSSDRRPRVFDDAAALALVNGNRDVMRQVARTFLLQAPEQLARLHEAAARKDAKTLQLTAHAVKGTAAYLAARTVCEVAGRVEAIGRTRRLAGAAGAVAELGREVNRLSVALRAFADESETRAGVAGRRQRDRKRSLVAKTPTGGRQRAR
jgi:CheY-like chemotaxis protein/HPt (histidine-containing phosphotransfer) domain-containing protein